MRRRILRTTAGMNLLTLADKALSGGRHVLLAALLGAGATMDALVIGLSVAELLVALVTGSFLAVFIPLRSVWVEEQGQDEADRRGLNLIFWLLLVLAGAGFGLALWGNVAAGWVGHGFDAHQHALTAALMPWLGVFAWGTGAAVLATGLYHVRERFLAPQMAQLLGRVAVLVGLLSLVPMLGVRAVAVALALAAVLVAALLAAGAYPRRQWPAASLSPRSSEIKAYFALSLPILAAAVVDQAVLFTDRSMASTLSAGGISALYYASVAWGIPVVLVCTNFATVLFPTLSRDAARRDSEALAATLSFAFRTMLLLMLGATALTLALSRDVIGFLFERGHFGASMADLTSSCLMALVLGLVFQGIGSVVNITLYAMQRTKVVAACGIARVIMNVVLNAVLMPRLGAVGIALSTSLTLAVWFAIIAFPFRRELRNRQVKISSSGNMLSLLAVGTTAALAAGLVAFGVVQMPWMAGNGTMAQLLRILVGSAAGLATYASLLKIMRVPEATAAVRVIKRRLGLGNR